MKGLHRSDPAGLSPGAADYRQAAQMPEDQPLVQLEETAMNGLSDVTVKIDVSLLEFARLEELALSEGKSLQVWMQSLLEQYVVTHRRNDLA